MCAEVLTRQDKGSVAVLTINRPGVHNSVDEATMLALERNLDECERRQTRVVVITGAGDTTFCAGGDLRYFDTLETREQGIAMSRRMQKILGRFDAGPFVSIAAVNGAALGGGCEILVACHFRVAASSATFAFRQAPNGLITGWGGGRRLLGLVPRSQALRLLLTGEKIDADEARRIGLVDEVVPKGADLAAAIRMAERIAVHPPRPIRAFLQLAAACDSERVVDLETNLFGECWVSEEFAEARKRFLRGER